MTETFVPRQLAVMDADIPERKAVAISHVAQTATLPLEPVATSPMEHSEPVARANYLLSTPELAWRWHLSTRTLQRWRALQVGPCWLCLRRTVLYRLADIEDYEASIRTGPDLRDWSTGADGSTPETLGAGRDRSSASKPAGGDDR